MNTSQTLFLIFTLWITIFGWTSTSERLYTFTEQIAPDSLAIANAIIAISEGQTVSLYHLKNGSKIAKFGKKGEGPGEFKDPPSVQVDKNKIIVNSSGKVSFFTRKGNFIREVNAIQTGRNFVSLGDRFIGYHSYSRQSGKRFSAINLYTRQFKKEKTVFEYSSIAQSQTGKGWRLFQRTYIQPIVCQNRIIVAGDVEFKFHIYLEDGIPFKTIAEAYERLPFTEADKKKVLHHYRTMPSTAPDYAFWKKNIIFPDRFPAIRSIHTGNKYIYVRTYRSQGLSSEFYIYHSNGKFNKRIFLDIAASYKKYPYPFMRDSVPFVFYKQSLFQLVLDDDDQVYLRKHLIH